MRLEEEAKRRLEEEKSRALDERLKRGADGLLQDREELAVARVGGDVEDSRAADGHHRGQARPRSQGKGFE